MIVHDDLLKEAAAAAMLEEIPTDLVVDEVETTTEKLLESSQAVGEISRNVEQVGVLTESMESFVSNFMATVPEGDWNARTARQFQMGLGSILSTVGVSVESSAYCSSFEAVGKTETADENREKSKEKSQGLVKRFYEALKAAIASFITAVTTWVSNIGKGEGAVRKMARNLESRAAAVKGSPSKDKFEGTPAWSDYLVADGKNITTKQAVQIAWERGGGQSIQWMNLYIESAKAVDKAIFDKTSLADFKFPDVRSSGFLEPEINWPGDIKTEVSFGEGNDFNPLAGKVVTKPGGTKYQGDVSVMSVTELKDAAVSLTGLANMLRDIQGKIRVAIGEVKKVGAHFERADGSKLGDADLREASSMLSKLIARVTIGPRAFTPIAGDVGRKIYKHADASLKLYGGSSTPATTEEK